jgi:hypothetical protein
MPMRNSPTAGSVLLAYGALDAEAIMSCGISGWKIDLRSKINGSA